MKDRLLNIQLTNEVQPKVTENKNHDWVSYGDGCKRYSGYDSRRRFNS